jgi:hypothetical protein
MRYFNGNLRGGRIMKKYLLSVLMPFAAASMITVGGASAAE